jgi:hypothetical protein
MMILDCYQESNAMAEENFENIPQQPRDQGNWARPVSKLKVSEVPHGATNINMDGLSVNSPLQGFGQLWQKTFRVRLSGTKLSPAEVMQVWKENFVRFQPDFNRFYPSPTGVAPGEVMFIDSTVPVVPNTPGVLPISTGILIMYSDENSFTVMTPEGHPESGWNTFSTFEEDGCTVAQIQSMTRATDPIYEFGFRYMGGTQMQDKTWTHMLRSLARALNVNSEVDVSRACLDPGLQWHAVRNLWKNAIFRTMFYKMGAPFRWARRSVPR